MDPLCRMINVGVSGSMTEGRNYRNDEYYHLTHGALYYLEDILHPVHRVHVSKSHPCGRVPSTAHRCVLRHCVRIG